MILFAKGAVVSSGHSEICDISSNFSRVPFYQINSLSILSHDSIFQVGSGDFSPYISKLFVIFRDAGIILFSLLKA